MSTTCDCDRKTTNGGTCDSSCKECEPVFVFEMCSRPRNMVLAPVMVASMAAGVETMDTIVTEFGQ